MGEAKKRAKATAAVTAKKGEKVEITVTDKGFEPDKVTVKKGEPVELVFTRTTDKTCIKEVVLDTGAPKKIQKALPLNKPVTIKTKFAKAGSLSYACNMNMFSGTVTVQ
jgi:plastocyanin domain-containing protein